MGFLNRDKAPFSQEVWALLDESAAEALELKLSGRQVVAVDGPHGLGLGAADSGKLDRKGGGTEGNLTWKPRVVHPLLEVRVPFTLSRADLEGVARGTEAIPLDPLDAAAAAMAKFEESAIYQGLGGSQIQGLQAASEHPAIALPKDPADLPESVSKAVETLQQAGVNGPYNLVLEADHYFGLKHATTAGVPTYTLLKHLLGGDVYWSPGIHGGILLPASGEDARLTLGQDLSLGYATHDEDTVKLFLLESFTFQVLDPGALVPLNRKTGGKKR